MSLTKEDLKVLSEPFDEKTIGVKVQSFSKDKTKASLVCYVQHTDVYTRIESVDPAWSSKVTDQSIVGDSCFVRTAVTIKGVTRENTGDGTDFKSATSDALKRTAMLFGVGRYLYDSETAWVNYNDATDRFKSWTLADHRAALRKGQAQTPTGKAPASQGTPKESATTTIKPVEQKPKTRAGVGAEILAAGKRLGLKEKEIMDWAAEFSGSPSNKMSIESLEKFLELILIEIGRNGVPA
jgi:hypothetical protein